MLYADLDYDSMQAGMASLARVRGVRVVRIDLPEPATRQSLIDAYEQALTANPDVRLMLLTHLSHRTGLIPPVKEITAMARSRGVDVLLDCGHALGQTEFELRDLGVDFAGLTCTSGSAARWVSASSISARRGCRISTSRSWRGPVRRSTPGATPGTMNYASVLSIADAIAVHEAIGPAAKARRLSYLRDRWVKPLRGPSRPRDPHARRSDPARRITSFRLAGQTTPGQNAAIRKALFDRHRIFTVERFGPAKGACIRVTPSFVNDAGHMDALVAALRDIAKA